MRSSEVSGSRYSAVAVEIPGGVEFQFLKPSSEQSARCLGAVTVTRAIQQHFEFNTKLASVSNLTEVNGYVGSSVVYQRTVSSRTRGGLLPKPFYDFRRDRAVRGAERSVLAALDIKPSQIDQSALK